MQDAVCHCQREQTQTGVFSYETRLTEKKDFLIKMFTLHMEKFLFLPLGRP